MLKLWSTGCIPRPQLVERRKRLFAVDLLLSRRGSAPNVVNVSNIISTLSMFRGAGIAAWWSGETMVIFCKLKRQRNAVTKSPATSISKAAVFYYHLFRRQKERVKSSPYAVGSVSHDNTYQRESYPNHHLTAPPSPTTTPSTPSPSPSLPPPPPPAPLYSPPQQPPHHHPSQTSKQATRSHLH